jgi:hypothetical protein
MHAYPDAVTHGYGTATVAAEDTHALVARLVAEALGGATRSTTPARNNNHYRFHHYDQGAQGPSPKCILLDPRMDFSWTFHTGLECRKPAARHIATATMQQRHGGSTRNMHYTQALGAGVGDSNAPTTFEE